MAQETIYRYVRRDVSGADLNDLAQNHPGPWFYGESPQDTVLIWAAGVPPTGAPWRAWRHARRFGSDGELSWWREADDTFTCRLLTGTDVAGWGERVEYTAVEGVPGATLLHGEYDESSEPPTWSEARIPRVFGYPVETEVPDLDTRVVLLTRTYRGPDGDLVDRLVAVETREIVEGG
jgi:hypothetical protein